MEYINKLFIDSMFLKLNIRNWEIILKRMNVTLVKFEN